MDLVDYMGRMEGAVSTMQLQIAALQSAVTAIPQLVLQTDPTMPAVVVPDYSQVVTPVDSAAVA